MPVSSVYALGMRAPGESFGAKRQSAPFHVVDNENERTSSGVDGHNIKVAREIMLKASIWKASAKLTCTNQVRYLDLGYPFPGVSPVKGI
jgi:hypothetical protein